MKTVSRSDRGIELIQQGLTALASELQQAKAPRTILLDLGFNVLAQGLACDLYLKALESERGVWVEKRPVSPSKVAVVMRGEMQPHTQAETIGYLLTVYPE